MSDELRIVIAAASIVFFAYVLFQVRKQKLLLPYAFFWLILAILGIAAIAVPSLVMSVAYALGFETASNFVFFAVLLLALMFLFCLSTVLTRLSKQLKTVVQELAILKEGMRDHSSCSAVGSKDEKDV